MFFLAKELHQRVLDQVPLAAQNVIRCLFKKTLSIKNFLSFELLSQPNTAVTSTKNFLIVATLPS